MTHPHHSIDEVEFQAFVDGQLPPDRRRAVMAYLAADGEEAARMSDYRTLNEVMHLLYDEVLHEPLPARLRAERYTRGLSWLERPRSWLGAGSVGPVPRMAALAAVVALSVFTGWSMHGQYYQPDDTESPAMRFARQAGEAHLLYAPDVRHPVEFGADQEDSLLVWLSERLGHSVHAPSLSDLGFMLVGGRLLPAAGQPAAQLMYENTEAAKRITLYLRGRWSVSDTSPLNSAQEGSVSYAREGNLSMVYWIEGPLAYALIGEIDRDQLFATAKLIQEQLEMPSLPTPAPTIDQTADKDAT
jgi:anti-sigma factor RsiW